MLFLRERARNDEADGDRRMRQLCDGAQRGKPTGHSGGTPTPPARKKDKGGKRWREMRRYAKMALALAVILFGIYAAMVGALALCGVL